MNKKAIILFSGGLDSTTCLAIAMHQGYEAYPLTFNYGQKHLSETTRAQHIVEKYGLSKRHKILNLPLEDIAGSSLTDVNIPVPDYQDDKKIPNTYVPARNTIFLSFALAWGEVIGAYEVFFGANFIDYSGYPDCRPDYIQAFEKVALLATKMGVEGKKFTIQAPLLMLDKKEIIELGLKLNIDYSLTTSCYRADAHGRACGTCDACTYRKKGFDAAKQIDPTLYF